MLDIKEIFKYLPHRYPFLLVDRISEIRGSEKIVGIKNVSFNENFFQGHFPNHPVMPGVLVCEAMAQLAAILVHNARGGMEDNKVFVLTGLDKVKFKRPVEPGDQLHMEVELLKRRGDFWKMQGVATVDGKVAARRAGGDLRHGDRKEIAGEVAEREHGGNSCDGPGRYGCGDR